jgi:hypothetical protein
VATSKAPPKKQHRSLRRVASTCALFAVSFAVGRGVAPQQDIGDLAHALGASVGGVVEPRDVRWEPSEGVTRDFLFGRWCVFLASDAKGGPRDVWRARVTLTPEGRPIEVSDVHDLTGTPLGDDHALVVDGHRAAFATYAFGQEQSVTLFDLSGEGAQNKTTTLADRAMAWVTNVQQTGRGDGVGRVDVTLDTPARAVGLALAGDVLTIDLAEESSRRRLRVDAVRGELVEGDGARAEASRHLPKRMVFWAVDTARAVPWIGPAPIAWLEDKVFALRDDARRFAFRLRGADDAETLAVTTPQATAPVALDASGAAVDSGDWPPARIPTIWKTTEPGEGEWSVPKLPWAKRATAAAPSDAPPAFLRTFVRPDPERPYSRVLLVAMDTRQLDLDMEAGVEDPKPLAGPHGAGHLPRDPAVATRVVAAFNGAFKTEHGNYGMMVHKRVLLPPQPSAASVVVLEDGRVGLGTWPPTTTIGGLRGIRDDAISSFRQNLDPLVDGDEVNPTKRSLWGFTLPGNGAQTERTGLCVTRGGHLVYAWGDDANATAIAQALHMAGCVYGMHLDMNPHHTGFTFTSIEDVRTRKYKADLLSPLMEISPDRYIEYAAKDFFYVMQRDPTPAPVEGAAWRVDVGTQPAPAWMPAVWGAHVRDVDLVEVQAGRATWRIRAGAKEPDSKAGAVPTRELTGDDAHRVLLSIGLGVSSEHHPAGLATDGKVVLPLGGRTGALTVTAEGALGIATQDENPSVSAHADLAELPLLVDRGAALTTISGPAGPRAALGLTADGRAFLARGSFASDAPLAAALVSAGCVRAVALDRGARADPVLRRAGTPSPPLASDDATTLFALAAPMAPRAFRFEAEGIAAVTPAAAHLSH